MICKVKETIEKYNLLNKDNKTVAVGFSGGADSVCLLHILSSLKEEYGIIVKAVHVNHNIRGTEAERDEAFARQFCGNLGVDIEVFSIDIPLLAKENKLSLEECGRVVRYECFEKVGCDAVAVAHTLSDSIETMLFNLARGTGTKGLSGITPSRDPNIIRPLISCTRQEIEAYCDENRLDYVTDSTNLSDDYTRNHIRHNLVPCFEKINADFNSSFLRAMNSLRVENDFIEQCAFKLISESEISEGYKLSCFNEAHEAVVKRSILFLLKDKMNKPPEAKHIDACFDMFKNGKGKTEISKDLYISVNGGIISFHRAEKNAEEWKVFFENNKAETDYGTFYLLEQSGFSENCFDADKIKGELFISSKLPGDKFTIRNRGITKSLKKLFNEMKIPSAIRNTVAVLHDNENVVWVEDIGVNSMYIPDKNSQKIITIKKDGSKC